MAVDLGILKEYSREVNDGLECLVHEDWLKSFTVKQTFPKEFIKHPIFTNDEIRHHLCQSSFKPSNPWCLIFVQIIEKNGNFFKSIGRKQDGTSHSKLSYSQIIHYVAESNYRNLWKEANSKLPSPYNISCSGSRNTNGSKKEPDMVKDILKRVFCCPKIQIDQELPSASTITEDDCHIGILNAYCIVESSSKYYILHPYMENTLHSCVTFSPSILDSTPLKLLFIIYQLLNVIKDIHDKGVHVGNIFLSDIYIDECLWIQVNPKSWMMHRDETGKTGSISDATSQSKKDSEASQKGDDLYSESLQLLVFKWVHGAISNFDYLMMLNDLARRKKTNPNYYPVLPWIMDFTVPKGGWRDLTKSKFRLNKGDQQLDLTYDSGIIFHSNFNEAEGNTYHPNIPQSQVPHHISDVLSDITYYVYKARCTPKSILCQHVRSKWVPAEYPSSMQRMQEWTPDECIPEFYDDPSIFLSMHDDLPDLEIPWWAENNEDFITKHRAALESDHVSRRLNHWIDLTFGYKLNGAAAISSKNVCLHLVDKHKNLTSSGVIQLFNHPHPKKVVTSLSSFNQLSPPYLLRKTPKESKASKYHSAPDEIMNSEEIFESTELSKSENFINKSKDHRRESRSRNSIIKSEDKRFIGEYNPAAPLLQFESEYNFLVKSNLCHPKDVFEKKEDETAKRSHNKVKDIQVLACLIAELYMAPKLRAAQPQTSLGERYKVVHQLFMHSAFDLPREVSDILKVLLQVHLPSDKLPMNYPAVSAIGLPPPSAHQLIQPLIKGFSFPSYFPDIYSLLSHLKRYSRLLNEVKWSDNISYSQRSSLTEAMLESKIKLTARTLSELLSNLNFHAVEIIIPFVKELVDDPETSVAAIWELFAVLSPSLGPKQTSICFLPSLLKLFSGERSSTKYLKLFHRSFLLQLIIGLGQKTFLTYFSTLLVEAVSGFKDFGPDGLGLLDETDSYSKKGSFLCSPQLQQNDSHSDLEESTDISPGANVLSPFDEKSTSPEPENNIEPEVFWLESPILEENEESDESSLEDSKDEEDDSSSDISNGKGGVSLSDNGELEVAHTAGMTNALSKNIPVPNTNSSSYFNQKTISASVPAGSTMFPEPEKQEVSSYHEQAVITKPDNKETNDQNKKNDESVILEEESSAKYNISDVAMDSIVWFAHRLGPVLTSKYLCRNLLRMLPLCYLDREQIESVPMSNDSLKDVRISNSAVVGDKNASKIISCLSCIATLYGEQIIMLQYLPYISEQVFSCKKRVSETGEAGLLSGMWLLLHIIPYLSDATLMDHLQELLLKDILYPSVQVLSSTKISFPCGGYMRQLICCKLVDILHMIGLRIGFEMTRKHLSVIIHRFFLSFDRIPEYRALSINESSTTNSSQPIHPSMDDQYLEIRKNSCNEYVIGTPINVIEPIHKRCSTPPVIDEKIPECIIAELKEAFCPKIASVVYISFCKLAGGIFMEETLTNDGMIRALCSMQDDGQSEEKFEETILSGCKTRKSSSKSDVPLSSVSNSVGGRFGGNVDVIGNRIDITAFNSSSSNKSHSSSTTSMSHSVTTADSKVDVSKIIRHKMDNTKRHLRGNWLAYWEHEIGCSEKNEKFNFKQIKLQTFLGHAHGIKAIHILDNENSFITASKDKTVKLWSLRSHGDGSAHSACQLTYNNHKKSVYSVTFLDSVRYVGSCDGSVHLWDPFMGSCIKQFESTKNQLTNLLVALPPPGYMFVAATSDSTIKFMDARSLSYVHEYKVNVSPAGLIRSIGISPSGNWIALGHSTGLISILDVRTGMISGVWKGHEGEILQLKVFNENTFVTSSLDYTMTVWNVNDNKARFHLRGPTEPVTCLNYFRNQIISGTTANRIGVHSSLDSQASFSSAKLRSDTFKGILTAAAILPLNKLLLLGSDSGAISLLC